MIPSVTPQGLRLRRIGFVVANILIYAAMLAALVHAIGWSGLTILPILAVAVFLPWSVLGFTTASIGAVLLATTRRVAPDESLLVLRTAVVMTLRNEDPARALARLRIVRRSLDATGSGSNFHCFVLSDTSDPAIARAEEDAVACWGSEVTYRRRTENTGYKAGNIMQFCHEQGRDFSLMLCLDADSLMSGEAIVQLVRIMQANPQVGLVQGLVVGLPASSVFTRMFQFGMRHGMRSYTVGQAWWTHDCGPFWGHNAIIRIAPFRDHCALPVLSGTPPFGGHILSHDQIEATLMRRAGYHVRLQVVAGGSWEDNPPTILDYIRRDTRWCQGNLQYLRLMGLPGLKPVSRFQVIWAILMFIGIPAWTVLIALLPLAGWLMRDLPDAGQGWLRALYWVFGLMYLWPKLVGYGHTLSCAHLRARYGGLARFTAGAICEIVFSLLQSSITSFHTLLFIVGLLLGRSTVWSGQARDARMVSWGEACRAFWPQTLFGAAVNGGMALACPSLLPWALPYTLGYLVAIPVAVFSASPRLGRLCVAAGLCAVPEDLSPPPEVAALTR